MKSLLAVLLLSGTLLAQQVKPNTPPVAPAVEAPQLTEAERVAVSSLIDKYKSDQEAMQQIIASFNKISADVERKHPGYHIDENTLQLIKNTDGSAVKPEAAK